MVCSPHRFTLVGMAGYDTAKGYQMQPQAVYRASEGIARPLYDLGALPAVMAGDYGKRSVHEYGRRIETTVDYWSVAQERSVDERRREPQEGIGEEERVARANLSYEVPSVLLYSTREQKEQDTVHERKQRLAQLIHQELARELHPALEVTNNV